MPELPEVETIRKILASKIVGKTIISLQVLNKKSLLGNPKDIIGCKIIGIDRRAKQLIIKLSNGKYLVIHLKMSGQLIYWQNEKLNLPNNHTRVILGFKDNSQLFFNDMRMFGWMKIIENSKLKCQMSKLGPEPLGKEFTVNYLQTAFAKSNRPIKQVLLDQKIIAGIGNIYANDILFEAGINPATPAKNLVPTKGRASSDDIENPRHSRDSAEAGKIEKLRKAIIDILEKAMKYKGSSAKDELYVQPTGEKGSYQEHFLVYQREGQPCKQCGGKIKRIKQAGRSSFYCPRCQK